jgi:hypothetical protein
MMPVENKEPARCRDALCVLGVPNDWEGPSMFGMQVHSSPIQILGHQRILIE